jgi:CheY-like chemotaxis protein
VAKILVADDNSNVQKTVALALTGLGVDVISVNNGEAAVRKLADVSPDLVLADIFMPVRNGYEVCEYVKKDSRFANVPVVLLVGAFDPLDEREAQRVGADGILKKPFVPPDPLITMVKALLDRSMGERHLAVAVSKPAAAVAGRSSGIAVADEPSPSSETNEESASQTPSIAAGRVSFEGSEHPVAFSQLLATPEQEVAAPATDVSEPVDNDQVLTSSRDANLGDPIFWRNDAPEPEKPQAVEDPEDLSAALDLRAWKQGENSLPRREEALLLQPIEPLELVRDDQHESSESVVDTKSILLDQAAQAPLHVDAGAAPELAANPLEWMATVPAEHADQAADEIPSWNAHFSEEAESITSTDLTVQAGSEQPVSWTSRGATPVPEAASLESAAKQPAESPVEFAIASPGAELTPSLNESPVSSPASSPTALPISARTEDSHEEKLPEIAKPALSPTAQSLLQSATDTAPSIRKHDWAEMTSELDSRLSVVEPLKDAQRVKPDSLLKALQSRLSESVKEPARTVAVAVPVTPAPNSSGTESIQNRAESSSPVGGAPLATGAGNSSASPANSVPAGSPDPALVEAVVQRVLDKMRPQVVDIITKEFLRPIVQALVHREIEKH